MEMTTDYELTVEELKFLEGPVWRKTAREAGANPERV
jgi:hypothetical protein